MISAVSNSPFQNKLISGSVVPIRQIIIIGKEKNIPITHYPAAKPIVNTLINILMKLDEAEFNNPELQKINEKIRESFKNRVNYYRVSNDYNKASRSIGAHVQNYNLIIRELKDTASGFWGLLTGDPVKKLDEAKIGISKAKRFKKCAVKGALEYYRKTVEQILSPQHSSSFVIFAEKIKGKLRPIEIIFP